ncbi:MAG: hypothetical protein AAB691_00255, partial [Patescibacteria group bacterium]
ESYSYYIEGKDLVIRFIFSLSPSIAFKPVVVIKSIDPKRIQNLDQDILDNFIFHLGLAEIPSYWKAAVSPKIHIKAGYLSSSQIRWWQELIENGLGEFFYVNKIPYTKNFVKIKTANASKKLALRKLELKNRYLVPMGGGKDSFITAELIKKSNNEFRTFVMGNVPAAENASRAVSSLSPIRVTRTIDPQLIALNKKGYLNGHTPFSSYLAFVSVLTAFLFDYRHIAISQEQSSNEGNIKVGKKVINHQYSKSFEFEKAFREYVSRYLSPDISFFSFLRPLHELQIAALFSQYPQYLSIFRSCNVNLKQNTWCGTCAKCFTIYLLLAPFLQEKTMRTIFKKNLLDDPDLWKYIPDFLGKTSHRSFDCIASAKETKMALDLIIKKYKDNNQSLPSLLGRCIKEFHPKKQNGQQFLRSWNQHHFLPKSLAIELHKAIS